ncbi:SH3 domain-containing protein [Candidatus Oleimmundimicrobium sp.]|uniref:SH3 domain-containing protein n=1 Tax=Candidatus Oleimmundimicrobium sp. TaxID=3060597 RepID=UPI0027244AFF|nr:SH3 domain-containing protein [Candidatus Oleimmundimicrobium sp.]MDO8885395.1 SH3 domain-containing protein [Candidatus Oleimmundimicrobium sp.]
MAIDETETWKKNITPIFPWILLLIVTIITLSIITTSFNENPKNTQEAGVEKSKEVNLEAEEDDEITETEKISVSDNNDQKYIGKIRILLNDLNLRDEPSITASVIKQLKKDTIFFVISDENGWYKITDEKETEGYVASSSKYVELIEE